jgi:hypothetical protein
LENPFTHQAQNGAAYVTSEAEASATDVVNSAAVPTHLAAILVVAAVGLWGLKKAGFRFVATAGAKTGFSA